MFDCLNRVTRQSAYVDFGTIRHQTLIVSINNHKEFQGEDDTLEIINPIPLVPPVTNATLPSTENNVLTSVDAISSTHPEAAKRVRK